MRYSYLSLFSGGMGLDLGLDRTGRFGLLACVERDAACCGTLNLGSCVRGRKEDGDA